MKIIALTCAFAVAAVLASMPAQAEDPVAIISQYRREHGLPPVKRTTRN